MFTGLTFFGIPFEYFLRLGEIGTTIAVCGIVYFLISFLRHKNGKD